MAYTTTAGTLIQRTRRFLRDTPDFDTLAASVTSNATTITVADGTLYAKRWPIEIDYETLLIRSISSNTLTVARGAYGSTAASHAASASILMRPAFYAGEILDSLNQALQATFPLIYKPVYDTTLTFAQNTYEYTVPNMPGTYNGQSLQIPIVCRVEALESGDLTYREARRWWLERGASRVIKFRGQLAANATLRVSGYGPFPDFATVTDTLDAQFPPQAEYLLPMFASAWLLMSGEAGRSRYDTGAVDRREEANRPGASLQVANLILARAREALLAAAMPPLPRHIKMGF